MILIFIESYILKLQKQGYYTDDLLEEYVGKLTLDSVFSKTKLAFIIKMAPVVDSRIFNLLHTDEELFLSVFMACPLNERIKINNRVINKSREKAYRDKDRAYMLKVARFVRGTHDDYNIKPKAYLNNMLGFYKEVKDTGNYIRSAEQYYKQHIEKLDMDSISKMEKEKFIDIKNGRIMGGKLLVTGNQINIMAWTIYEMTDDPQYLGMALKWAKEILVYQNSTFHDTFAHILYKIGAKAEAVQWQQKAIDIAKLARRPSKKLEIELHKMKMNEL